MGGVLEQLLQTRRGLLVILPEGGVPVIAVLLQLRQGGVALRQAADLDQDTRLTAADLTLLKRLLLTE